MRQRGILLLGVVIGLLAGAFTVGAMRFGRWFGHAADPVTIASASLQAVRAENSLTVFSARFVAVVTSEQDRFLLSARKTLIMPGTVRYDIDLSRLTTHDLHWNAAARVLTVDLPPVTASTPAIDLTATREYSGGGVLMALTAAEHDLDAANRAAALTELTLQARQPLPIHLAQTAAVTAIEQSFGLPLKAAGIDATVLARMPEQR